MCAVVCCVGGGVVVALMDQQDMLGGWSLIPVLAVGLCLWSKWKSQKEEVKAEKEKLEEVGWLCVKVVLECGLLRVPVTVVWVAGRVGACLVGLSVMIIVSGSKTHKSGASSVPNVYE